MAKDDVAKKTKSVKDADKKKAEENKPKTEVKKRTPAKTKAKKEVAKKPVKKEEIKAKPAAKKQTTSKKKPDTKKKTTAKPKEEKEKEVKTEEEEVVEEEKEEYKAKKKPKLSKEQKERLRLRKQIKKRTPDFLREEWFRYKRIPKNWRRPDGITSKMRINLKYRPSKVRVGFRGPRDTRGLHSSGFEEIIVYNVNDLKSIDPKTQAARIGSTVGTKKRVDIEKKAEELDVRILNM